MTLLILALVATLVSTIGLYCWSEGIKKIVIEEMSRREAAEEKLKRYFVEIQDLKEVNGDLSEAIDKQKLYIEEISSKNSEAFANIDVLNEKIEAQKIAYVKLMKDNETLRETVEKLSQKELIEECRLFYNTLEQNKKDIGVAIGRISVAFDKVRRIYSAQTTVDDCVTTVKRAPVSTTTDFASGQCNAKYPIGVPWPHKSKFWDGSEE